MAGLDFLKFAKWGRTGDQIADKHLGGEAKVVRAGSLLPEEQENEVPLETGIGVVDGAQRLLGLDTGSGRTRAVGMLAGSLLPGGTIVQVFMDGKADEETTDEALQEMLKYKSVTSYVENQTGQPVDVEALRGFLEVHNPVLEEHIGNQQNFIDGVGSSVSGLGAGGLLGYLIPGGMLVKGVAAVGGGVAGSLGYNYARGRMNETNIPAMLAIAAHYEENGGEKDETYMALITALTHMNEKEHAELEEKLGMKLEEALIQRIQGEEIRNKGGYVDGAYHHIAQVMKSDEVDIALRLATGEMAGRGEALLAGGNVAENYSLSKLYAASDLSIGELALGDTASAVREHWADRQLDDMAAGAAEGLKQGGVRIAHGGDGAALPMPGKKNIQRVKHTPSAN